MQADRLPFARVRAQMRPVMGAVHAIQPAGAARKLLSVNAAPLLAADGAFAGMVASIRDITRDHRDHALGERSSSVLRALADFDTFALAPHTAQEILAYACRSLCERGVCMMRSEESRVGKECGGQCRSRWSPSP